MRPCLAGGEEGLRVERDPHHPPVGRADAAHDVVVRAARPQRVDGGQLVGRLRRAVRPHGRAQAVAERPADDLVVVASEDTLRTGVARGDPRLRVDQDHALRHCRDDRLVASLARVQGVVHSRVGDDDPEALGRTAVCRRQRVVVDAKGPAADGGEHADDGRARVHHAAAQAGGVGREPGEHLGDLRPEELPARPACEGGERRVRAREAQFAVDDGTADRHALDDRLEERDGRRCLRRVAMHRLQGVLLGSSRGVYRSRCDPAGGFGPQARGCALKYAFRTCSAETCVYTCVVSIDACPSIS